MNKLYDIVLFDLDGTLIDSGPGIISSITYALKNEGIKIPDKTEMRRFIGPPIQKGLMEICGLSKEKSKELSIKYREYYEKNCWNKNELYPGIKDLLKDLKSAGILLAIATSRPESSALKIINYYGLDKIFDEIITAKDDNPHIPKKDLIKTAVLRCEQKSGLKNLSAVMVGDTHYDMDGARLYNIPAIGVTYGYGTREELLESGAAHLASSAKELKSFFITSD